MNLEEYLFARKVAERIRSGTVTEDSAFFRITGVIVGEMTLAPIEILSWKSDRLRLDPPSAWCRERWMRDNSDWHNSAASGMCWVLGDQWRDEMQESKTNSADLIQYGSLWLVEATKSLIDRHYHAFRFGIVQWPGDWTAFSHYDLGRLEYERERKLRQSNQT